MKSRKRPFKKDILNHCYQRSADGGVIFYSQLDHLVWFTSICVAARKYDVQILAMCPMPDHVHRSARAASARDLSGFMGKYSHDFALEYNRICRKSGPVFQHPFGSAPKYGAKKGRANLIYIGNNLVERQLARYAEEARWSLVAYAVSDHPFSEPLVPRTARRPMQRAVKEVLSCRKEDIPLRYRQLQRIFTPLTAVEKQQLTDFIISRYNAIDYPAALEFFDGNYEQFLLALHSNTGSEYDLNEVFLGKTDKPYAQMTKILLKEKGFKDIHEFLTLDNPEKYELFLLLRKHTNAMAKQIARYLHLPIKEIGPEDNYLYGTYPFD